MVFYEVEVNGNGLVQLKAAHQTFLTSGVSENTHNTREQTNLP